MEAYRGADISNSSDAWQLTKLYSDAKQIYTNVFLSTLDDDGSEVASLHRKFRIQKDRLIAWGFEWSDNDAGIKGNIDSAVEQAGMTEIVQSVMENIKDILDVADKVRKTNCRPAIGYPPEKGSIQRQPKHEWSTTDKDRYKDTVNDLTTAIDLLCDLTKARRAAREEQATTVAAFDSHHKSRLTQRHARQAPPFDGHDLLSQTSHMLARMFVAPQIEASALDLPAELPPPYGAVGVAPQPRVFAQMRYRDAATHPSTLEHSSNKFMPIMVEYEAFDTMFKEAGVPLPKYRLEKLYQLLGSHAEAPPACFPKLLGYFEDPKQARLGLVYELSRVQTLPRHLTHDQPRQAHSLLHLLQTASRLHMSPNTSGTLVVPPLEDRFRLAFELLTGYKYLFDQGFSHRNVQSANVIFFATTPTGRVEGRFEVRKPMLCAFDLFSEHNIESSPEFLHENIYRHPDDPRVKGPTSSREYYPDYDLYSLGLVLLEIGLWIPLADIFKEKYSLKDFKTRIEKVWCKRLASKCGSLYMKAVQECLAAGDDVPKPHEALLHTYKRVTLKLQKCCLVDEDVLYYDEAQLSQPASPDVGRYSNTKEQEDETHLLRHVLETPAARIHQHSQRPSHDRAESVTLDMTPASSPAGQVPRHLTNMTPKHNSMPKTAPSTKHLFPDMKLSADILEQWNVLGDQLARSVTKALRHSKESFSVDILCIGEQETTAKPTLCVMCSSTKRVRAFLKRNFRYDRDSFDLIVLDGKVVRSKSTSSQDESVTIDTRKSAALSKSKRPRNPFHHTRPLCGASIGAWRNEEHLAPVSFGGVVMVDGEPFGMSVHHLLEDPEEEDEADAAVRSSGAKSQGTRKSRIEIASQSETSLSTSMSLPVLDLDEVSIDLGDWIASTDSGHEDSEDELFDSDESEEEGHDMPSGDMAGVGLGEGKEIVITQPALDDVDKSFFPSNDDRDEDHLDSHSLGFIHASSGIRRLLYHGAEQEVDWALIKLEDDRLQPYNVVAGGRRFCAEGGAAKTPKLRDPVCRSDYDARDDLFPTDVAKSDNISGLDVHSFGRTSGLETGRVTQAMQFVRYPGRTTYSRSWCVTGNFGMGGDSGAWVIDNEHGQVCGHVLAYSRRLARAYISPMDMMFEDMKRQLGAQRVYLLGAKDQPDVGHGVITKELQCSMPDLKNLRLADASRPRAKLKDSRSPMCSEWVGRKPVAGRTAS